MVLFARDFKDKTTICMCMQVVVSQLLLKVSEN